MSLTYLYQSHVHNVHFKITVIIVAWFFNLVEYLVWGNAIHYAFLADTVIS